MSSPQSALDRRVMTDAGDEVRLPRKQGNQLLQLDQPQAALECFDRALACDATDTVTLAERGLALQALQRFPEAIDSYDRALRIKPGLAGVLTNRSNALRSLKRFEEALLDLDEALRIKPAFAEALNNRGNVLRDLGRLEESIASFDAALALKPEFPMALCNRGNALLDLKRPPEALDSFEAALRLVPEDGEACFGRASALLQLEQRLEEAIADFDLAAERGIERPEILVGKAAALAKLGRHGAAAACLSELLQIAPHREYVRGSLMHSRLQTCDWTDLPAQIHQLSDLVQQGRKAAHPHSLLLLTDSPELHLACARVFAGDKYAPDASLGPCAVRAAASEAGQGRIRVAYVSADFHEHPVSHLLVGALERHDRRRFEVIGVSLRAGDGGPFGRRVRGAFDQFIEVTERSDREVAQLLRELRIDIAVDLMGFTDGLRLGIFAHRAAPVQMSYLGYPGTLGAPYMDYLLADDVVIPREEERLYGECVVRLPHCFLPNDDRREIGRTPVRAQAGLPEQGFVFCAFTGTYKINAPVFEIWMRLLREVPGSVLWLREMAAEAAANLQKAAKQRGVDPQRLIVAPRLASMADHLGRHVLADLYLDTLPYNAHSTTCDALWAGVPVLTCAGRSFAARVAASALTAVGLPELITYSLEEYERKALQLARDPQQLQALRTRLAQTRTRSALFDTTLFCRHLEAAYCRMHERAMRGERPAAFAVEPLPARRDAAGRHE